MSQSYDVIAAGHGAIARRGPASARCRGADALRSRQERRGLPFVAAASLLFYLLAQDKRNSRWEGMLFLVLFALFITKVAGLG